VATGVSFLIRGQKLRSLDWTSKTSRKWHGFRVITFCGPIYCQRLKRSAYYRHHGGPLVSRLAYNESLHALVASIRLIAIRACTVSCEQAPFNTTPAMRVDDSVGHNNWTSPSRSQRIFLPLIQRRSMCMALPTSVYSRFIRVHFVCEWKEIVVLYANRPRATSIARRPTRRHYAVAGLQTRAKINAKILRSASRRTLSLMGCLHDPANVQQTFSKCIQNTRANAGRLLDVCWIV